MPELSQMMRIAGWSEHQCSQCGEQVIMHARFLDDWDGLCEYCWTDQFEKKLLEKGAVQTEDQQ